MELDALGRSADRASRIICGLHAALTLVPQCGMSGRTAYAARLTPSHLIVMAVQGQLYILVGCQERKRL